MLENNIIRENNNGLVSVIMGIFNCSEYLPEAIESIMNQTYDNIELIICDDCSTDESYKIAEKYKERYPDKIKLIKNTNNRKLAYSLNHCLKYAKGEFVARMDGDDISEKDRFSKQVKYLIEHRNVDLVGCNMKRFNNNGMADEVCAPEKPNRYTLHNRMPFNHATIMTYYRVYEKLGGYTVAERTNRAQDYDLWFRFFAEGFCGYNIQECLYRVREDDAAIRRRTFKVRWNAFKTTVYGYRLLNYPKIWLIRPALLLILKTIIPYRVVGCFRKYQKDRFEKKHNNR